ncbi:MAG: transcriptional regulator [Bacteroidetes bacterium]|jgi:TetR/AcrR family transcriptional repressor of nem operon|nr:transcriptional regulator [Bacteroidota bacterium]
MSKAERTRQYIIEKTAPVFNAKGYSGTSMNDIMEATGLTKGSIYGNFENKDEVAIAAFDYNFGNITALISSRIREKNTAIDKLLVYPQTHRNILKIPFLKAGCPLLNTSVDADDTHPELRERAVKALNLWRSSIVKIIDQGIKTKEIKKGTNPVEFAAILVSLTEGAVMQAKVTGKPAELNITMDFLEKLIRDLKR